MVRSFPKGFLWGTATASHQVEGSNHNNWSEWEKDSSHIADKKPSGIACDHYHRYEQDLDLCASMGNNSHRFSLEWSRLEPKPGEWNEDGFLHYRNVLQALAKRGLKPLVTLHHFTNPVWFEKQGGFLQADSPPIFNRYVEKAVSKLGDLADFWVTINEPVVYAYQGYVLGIWPPGRKNLGEARQVLRNLLKSHALAYRTLHDANSDAQVGIAKHVRIFDPLRPGNRMDRWAAKLYHKIFNSSVMTALATGIFPAPVGDNKVIPGLSGSQDFIGINYYTRGIIQFKLLNPGGLFACQTWKEGSARNSLGWEIYPDGLYRTITEMKQYNLPIYITENGTTVDEDSLRLGYVHDHLEAIVRSLNAGALVRGYFYWSAMDNFEWAEGYTARFGLVDVDFKT
ncbi:MAG: glycoside hydrolase family 1 protein, partial [Spirochaetaceae bacterium]